MNYRAFRILVGHENIVSTGTFIKKQTHRIVRIAQAFSINISRQHTTVVLKVSHVRVNNNNVKHKVTEKQSNKMMTIPSLPSCP